jgi:hypothetical protein
MRILDLTRDIIESKMKFVAKYAAVASRPTVYDETLIF